MKIIRPIVFIDTETTGTNREEDRIIEISAVKILPGGGQETKTRRINPGIPIPAGATEIHGITDDMVKDCPVFKQVAASLLSFIKDCDLAGFNSNAFDFPLLYNEFQRAGFTWNYKEHHMIDVGNIFKILNPRNLEAAVKHYLNREHDGAHGAEADTIATAEVFMAMLSEEIPQTIEELALYSNYDKPMLDLSGKFTTDKDGTILFAFGKYRNEPAADHIDFCEWMMFKASFPPDTRAICEQILKTQNIL